VFEGLRKRTGLNAKAILKADADVLLELATMGGMRPRVRVFRWQEIARITMDQFGGDLNQILHLPYAHAKKALKQFPNIGDPGAEKILMFCGASPGLPLEWNGLRVLTRVGYGRQQKNYGAAYRSVQEALTPELSLKPEAIAQAHLLLRQHGKEICRDKTPRCYECPVKELCTYPPKQVKIFGRGA
jgi:endonuclease-3